MHDCYGDQTKEGAALMPEMRSAYKILVGKLEWKRRTGGSSRRHAWEGDKRKGLKGVRCENVDTIQLAQERGKVAEFFEPGNELPGSVMEG